MQVLTLQGNMYNNILQSMVFGMMNSFLGVFNKK